MRTCGVVLETLLAAIAGSRRTIGAGMPCDDPDEGSELLGRAQ